MTNQEIKIIIVFTMLFKTIMAPIESLHQLRIITEWIILKMSMKAERSTVPY